MDQDPRGSGLLPLCGASLAACIASLLVLAQGYSRVSVHLPQLLLGADSEQQSTDSAPDLKGGKLARAVSRR